MSAPNRIYATAEPSAGLIKEAAAYFQSRIDAVRSSQYAHNRAAGMSEQLVPLRHLYHMHRWFPFLVLKIPEYYPSNCDQFDCDAHLAELEAAIREEEAAALLTTAVLSHDLAAFHL
jgi:hypothetical protein